MPYGGGMRQCAAILLLALASAAAQDLPNTYAPLMANVPNVVQVDCREYVSSPLNGAACYTTTSTPEALMTQLDAQATEIAWTSSWQVREDIGLIRGFALGDEAHLAMLSTSEDTSYLGLVPAASLSE